MHFKSKKIPFLILCITALVCSQILFSIFNDPEGPNLLVISALALIVFFVSLTVYLLNTSSSGLKRLLLAIFIQILVVVVFYSFNSYKKLAPTGADYKDSTYHINGATIQLTDGFAETEAAPGSVSRITTRYFGNEYMTDLNSDGREDVVFLLTQDTGGSGVFYYVVAALNTPRGPVGSDGYLLGDRIAPQTIEASQNPRHQNVIVVNYADRAPGEPMVTQPSVGKSAYLKLDTETMMWGIVEPDFEGESR